jgi:hypothetical protein
MCVCNCLTHTFLESKVHFDKQPYEYAASAYMRCTVTSNIINIQVTFVVMGVFGPTALADDDEVVCSILSIQVSIFLFITPKSKFTISDDILIPIPVR